MKFEEYRHWTHSFTEHSPSNRHKVEYHEHTFS